MSHYNTSQTSFFSFFGKTFVKASHPLFINASSAAQTPPSQESYHSTPIHMKGRSYSSDILSQKDTEMNFHQGESDAVTLKQLDLLQFKISQNLSVMFI